MPDHAHSDDQAVQAQLDRLWSLSPGADVLGLERITRLLALLGDPHRRLPPVFHVAGTNGKGSTCAFLRAGLEAAGYRVHAYTSPHLVRFNERIRLAGTLIDDAALAALLAQVLDAAEQGGVSASFFEVTTAAAFLAFATVPADACVIEVGLGGRLDATNVLPSPAVCGIAALGIDHEAFLGDTLPAIATEKAGIAKPGVPLVTMRYDAAAAGVVAAAAQRVNAPLLVEGRDWTYRTAADATIDYRDGRGALTLPSPALGGAHQNGNLALATAMLRHQQGLPIDAEALAAAATRARWPARLQRLGDGPLVRTAPAGTAVWLDGGHNPSAGAAIAAALPTLVANTPLTVVIGMLANKDATGFLAPFAASIDTLIAVPVPGHEHHAPAALAETACALGVRTTLMADDLEGAFASGALTGAVLVAGSLYLAGEMLRKNDEPPT